MITAQGPKLIEYNARFGDPECQVLMMRMQSDLVPALLATCDRMLASFDLRWFPDPALTVVMAAKGYPGDYPRGSVISGLDEASKIEGVEIFHAGTKAGWRAHPRQWRSRAERVGHGKTVAEAQARAYGGRQNQLAARLLPPRYRVSGGGAREVSQVDRPNWLVYVHRIVETMSDLADLFPGYASHWIDTSAGKMFARAGGKGPPLLALHGYPETHVMWHRVAPALAEHFTVVLVDLPGYGWSAVPEADKEHAPYTKRAMAAAMVDIMEALGHVRFNLAGHDRGGRVSYRLALDHPGRVEKLAVLDIIPTWNMWTAMDARLSMRLALAVSRPALPAAGTTAAQLRQRIFRSAHRSVETRQGHGIRRPRHRALSASFTDPLRIHAGCEDYRAGQSTDFQHDEGDRKAGKKITCPMLAVWGATGLPSQNSPLEVWREWATDVRGFPIESGHFLCEENPEATSKALLDFFLNRAI